MSNDRGFHFVRWGSLAFIAGGVLMAVLWVVFTIVHGPTSFNEDQAVLGHTMFFWGSLLGDPPNLLVALGLLLLNPSLPTPTRRLARGGYTLTMIGLIVPACIDLFIGALGPPFFVPVVGIGCILLALRSRHTLRLQWQTFYVLMLIGKLQLIAFALALIPLDVSDQMGGFRIHGLFAHFLTGIGWVALGVRFWKTQAPSIIESPQS